MRNRIPIKNHQQEVRLITHRCLFILVLLGILILGLLLRLVYLQINKHEMYTTMATNNWLGLVPIEPTRGLIFDRNGKLLADNTPVFSLDIIPYDVHNNMDKTLSGLASIVSLTEEDIKQFKKQLRQHRRFDEIPLKLKLTEQEVARFTENQHRFPGVMIKARLMRYYPFGSSFSHVVGYVGRINTQELNEIDQSNYSASHYIGKLGIEKFYEDDLHGRVGYQQAETDASGKSLRILKEIKSTPGKNIYLTLDIGLQLAAEKALQGIRGAIVAIQPETGQVLAMVSNPGFDPNLFVAGISRTDYHALRDSPDRPLYDRALRGLYPLASTIKPYLALQGLNTGIINDAHTVYDPGYFQLHSGGREYHCWAHRGHGTVNVSRAITSSCDTFFYDLAMHMGIRRIDTILEQFGFGDLTGIDLENELAGNVPSPEWKKKTKGAPWYEGDTVISAIGQGFFQATPIQLASAVATLANRGKRFMPYLMLRSQQPGLAPVDKTPTALEPVAIANKEYWDTVIDAMEDVIATPQGTAYRYGRNHTYTVAAKTGTAQVIARRGNNGDNEDLQEQIPERFRDHHLFIAFAPTDKPQIAVGIITENSSFAIEAARALFDYYLGQQANATRPDPAAPTETIVH